MRSVWVLHGEADEMLGMFSTREAAEAAIHPSVRDSGKYTLTEEPVDSFAPGEVYGPVWHTWIDLETGDQDPSPGHVHCICRVRPEGADDEGRVAIYRKSSQVHARSTVSPESALATARRLREEHLAAGKPTRLPVERVQLEGDTTAALGWKAEFPSPVEVTPGAVSVQFPAAPKQGLVAAIEFRRTGRRTPEGLAVFALATS